MLFYPANMKNYFLICLLISSFSTSAQLQENFSDSNFSTGPAWTGDTMFWKVNAQKELQSVYAPAAQNIYLSTIQEMSLNVTWEFLVKLQFNPSNSNHMRVYLTADHDSLTRPLQGYYIRIGEDGADDSFDLYRQDTDVPVKLIDGIGKRATGDMVQARIRVTRDEYGAWELYTDTTGGFNFVKEGSCSDLQYTGSAFCGIYANYTSTRSDRFFFDEITITELEKDTISPFPVSVNVQDSIRLELLFSEPLNKATATNTDHYLLDDLPGTVNEAQLQGSKVMLMLTAALAEGNHKVRARHVTDLSKNETDSTIVLGFIYKKPFEALYGQVLINELLADPNPVVDLPEAEFIELRNLTNNVVKLKDWKLNDASVSCQFGNDSILPYDFLIICRTADTPDYRTLGRTAGLSCFPLLNNSSDRLQLISKEGRLIDSVTYSDSWYPDSEKKNGGYTLERIHALTSCQASMNWTASADTRGGTPGSMNSADGSTDTLPLRIVSLNIENDTTILLGFDKAPDPAVSSVTNHYKLNPGGHPLDALPAGPDLRTMRLHFPEPFKQGFLYTLETDSLHDCGGNKLAYTEKAFMIPVPSGAGQVLINEVFADPFPPADLPAAEFIELRNMSLDTIMLEGWVLADSGSSATFGTNSLLPGGFLILSSVQDALMFSGFGKVAGLPGFPLLNNAGDYLRLFSREGELIDSVRYSDAWYRDTEKKKGGYTLERIHGTTPCYPSQNWIASADPSGGTPGMTNSADGSTDHAGPDLVSLTRESERTLLLRFDEPLQPDVAGETGHYAIDLAGYPGTAVLQPDHQSLQLLFSVPFSKGVQHTLTVSGLRDCAGNVSADEKADFMYSHEITQGDVLINEALFNPHAEGADFVEIYIYADRLTDLSRLRIARVNDLDSVTAVAPVSLTPILAKPGSYFVLSADGGDIRSRYFTTNPSGFIDISGMPSFPDANGIILLLNDSMQEIDRFSYRENMHFSLMEETEGVSLERIRFNRPASEPANWHSAASAVGYATPAYRNSQAKDEQDNNSQVSIEPALFSPDNDGTDDLLTIHYAFGQSGLLGNLHIYTDGGRLVRRLATNELLGSDGLYAWDGTDEAQQRTGSGMYIIYFEVTDVSGHVETYKRTAVLDLH